MDIVSFVKMNSLMFNLFNRTFGKGVRAIQRTLIKNDPNFDLHDLVVQMARKESADYVVRNLVQAMPFKKREELWDFCINRIHGSQPKDGIILEFGVFKGESINYFAKRCPDYKVYGFDSFEGLEADWVGKVGHTKGTFDMNGRLPKCEKNVELIRGWFESTLPVFMEELGSTQVKILHMDADTYKPTAFVLNTLSKNLAKGTVVIFDEYFGYPNFRSHEFKAWRELIESTDLIYDYIGYSEFQVAVEVK